MFEHLFIFGQNVQLPKIDICPSPKNIGTSSKILIVNIENFAISAANILPIQLSVHL